MTTIKEITENPLLMKDQFGRTINYLRVSVIDKCNLRCIYCDDGQTYKKVAYDSIITYEEILKIVSFLKQRGLRNVKITGGEPLLRKNLYYLIKSISNLGMDVSLTTNAVLLAKKAQRLYSAGLKRINIGLDCLERDLFRQITGFDNFNKVIDGLNEAIRIGFDPIKINVVLIKGLNENIKPWIDFIKEKPLTVRFIELMPFVNGFKPVSNVEIKAKISTITGLREVKLPGNGPAKHYSLAGYEGNIGFISPRTDSFCSSCTRLRIDAKGQLHACLYDNHTFDYLSLVRNGFSEEKLEKLVSSTLFSKPENNIGLEPLHNMCEIGG